MKILVLNCGSSSLKYQLINMETEEVVASGKYERIGEQEAFITHKANGQKKEIKNSAYNHTEAIEFALQQLINPEYKVIDNLDEIDAIGHRLVHGGEKISESVVIDDEVIDVLKECTDLAPLHNPASILGIEACKKVMPGKPMVGVFDTAFHQTIPQEKYIYPIPYKYYKNYKIRKYGFHGKSIDTSMGLSPLGGIPMVTRSGDMDPSVLTYIMKKDDLSADEMEAILNKESGVSGISGLAPDFRIIEEAANEGNERAKIAMESFKYAIASYIAKYAVAMNGVDAIVFTGGVGENQINIRKGICEQLTFMGVEIDEELNNMRGEEKLVSKSSSKVKIYVIPTNEELMIAKETKRLAK